MTNENQVPQYKTFVPTPKDLDLYPKSHDAIAILDRVDRVVLVLVDDDKGGIEMFNNMYRLLNDVTTFNIGYHYDMEAQRLYMYFRSDTEILDTLDPEYNSNGNYYQLPELQAMAKKVCHLVPAFILSKVYNTDGSEKIEGF